MQSKEISKNSGHIHKGWVATVEPSYQKLAMAMEILPKVGHEKGKVYLFDASNGEPVDYQFPVDLSDTIPVDLDGDGYHEFYYQTEQTTCLLDKRGEVLCRIGGKHIKATKMLLRAI